MRIVFMGTPDFAVPALEMLAADQNVIRVVTKPDKPGKRGKRLISSPVKLKADELGIPVSQPERIKGNHEFFRMITDEAPDLIVVAAYGKILPPEILEIPELGSINIHASLLPRFRGAAPIHRAVLEGDEQTGVSIMKMCEGLDEGDVLAVEKIDIDNKTSGELYEELAIMGARLLKNKLKGIENGEIKGFPQDHSLATYAPMIEKKDARVDFSKSGEQLERLVRAMTPLPGAYTFVDGQKMKIICAHSAVSESKKNPGTVLKTDKDGIEVKAGGGSSLVITMLQMPGKKIMDVASFLRGNKLEEGRQLG